MNEMTRLIQQLELLSDVVQFNNRVTAFAMKYQGQELEWDDELRSKFIGEVDLLLEKAETIRTLGNAH